MRTTSRLGCLSALPFAALAAFACACGSGEDDFLEEQPQAISSVYGTVYFSETPYLTGADGVLHARMNATSSKSNTIQNVAIGFSSDKGKTWVWPKNCKQTYSKATTKSSLNCDWKTGATRNPCNGLTNPRTSWWVRATMQTNDAAKSYTSVQTSVAPKFVNVRWLGAAGLEFEYNGNFFLIDPYLSREYEKIDVVTGNHLLEPNADLAKAYLDQVKNCGSDWSNIMVTHSHFDHAEDVPNLMTKATSAHLYSFTDTYAYVYRAKPTLASRLHEFTSSGTTYSFNDSINVTAYEWKHDPINGKVQLTSTTPISKSGGPLTKIKDLVMNKIFAYRFDFNGIKILVAPGREPLSSADLDKIGQIDVLFISNSSYDPASDKSKLKTLLEKLKPVQVIPLHFDDYYQPFNGDEIPSSPLTVGLDIDFLYVPGLVSSETSLEFICRDAREFFVGIQDKYTRLCASPDLFSQYTFDKSRPNP